MYAHSRVDFVYTQEDVGTVVGGAVLATRLREKYTHIRLDFDLSWKYDSLDTLLHVLRCLFACACVRKNACVRECECACVYERVCVMYVRMMCKMFINNRKS